MDEIEIRGDTIRLGQLLKLAGIAESGADDSIEETLKTMMEYKVRRLPVIDGHDLIGIVSQADVARNIDEQQVGDLVEAIST